MSEPEHPEHITSPNPDRSIYGQLSDADLLAWWKQGGGEPGDPEYASVAIEIHRRGLDL